HLGVQSHELFPSFLVTIKRKCLKGRNEVKKKYDNLVNMYEAVELFCERRRENWIVRLLFDEEPRHNS
ncbi:hypothetical protein, partial [uncultured Idiomarina sp.]|uniref:hypothetical protein n=1 Tax=uncultured Idiomarina sp. TaxID=352961 RepID=UPI002594E270